MKVGAYYIYVEVAQAKLVEASMVHTFEWCLQWMKLHGLMVIKKRIGWLIGQ